MNNTGGGTGRAGAALEALSKERRLCNHPILLLDEKYFALLFLLFTFSDCL